jgi:hypothetical protein
VDLPTSKSDVLDSEREEEAAYERLLDRMDEDLRRLREQVRADQVASERRRWWVIGPWTSVF